MGLFGLLLACSFGFPFSKTLIVLAGGILASQGVGNLSLYMLVGLAGLVTADSIFFSVGYLGGKRVLRWRVFLRPKFREKLEVAQNVFQEKGGWAVFGARFTPFVRTAIYLSAGLSRMAPARPGVITASCA